MVQHYKILRRFLLQYFPVQDIRVPEITYQLNVLTSNNMIFTLYHMTSL